MSHIEDGFIDDATTKQMIDAAHARDAQPTVDSVTAALLDARFRAFEIGMRIDSVIAGVRSIRRTVRTELDVA